MKVSVDTTYTITGLTQKELNALAAVSNIPLEASEVAVDQGYIVTAMEVQEGLDGMFDVLDPYCTLKEEV